MSSYQNESYLGTSYDLQMRKTAYWFYGFVIPAGAAHFAAERRDLGFPGSLMSPILQHDNREAGWAAQEAH